MMTKYHIFYVKTIGFSAPFEKVFKRKLESFNPFIFNLEQEHEHTLTVFQIISKNSNFQFISYNIPQTEGFKLT